MNPEGPNHLPYWDQLTLEQKAPYLQDARVFLGEDLFREGQPEVVPEEFEDAVRKAAEETYAVIREQKLTLIQPIDGSRAVAPFAELMKGAAGPRAPGQRVSL